MTDKEIKDALKEFECWTHIEINGKRLSTPSIEIIKDILQRYLSVKMPEKKE